MSTPRAAFAYAGEATATIEFPRRRIFMITRIRTFTPAKGKRQELIALLKEIGATASRILGRPAPPVAVTIGGDLNKVSLIMEVDGVDAHDELIAKLIAHPEIAPLNEKLFPLIESGYDTIYRHV
jgi:hypothetical protein